MAGQRFQITRLARSPGRAAALLAAAAGRPARAGEAAIFSASAWAPPGGRRGAAPRVDHRTGAPRGGGARAGGGGGGGGAARNGGALCSVLPGARAWRGRGFVLWAVSNVTGNENLAKTACFCRGKKAGSLI